ncbi:GNAT family N-acetyltransferase [Candidatus Leptofilum sp.]|uniref:GNAT family N-acetyltransferase n=1 Tax=Candidatus Leptofilum sp. TaxID=3241576 RepID=UPI003B5CA662
MMQIRVARVADAEAIWQLHNRSVLSLCAADYSLEQLADWVKHSTLARQQARLKKHCVFVAEEDDRLIGFVRWNPATNELCSLFVDPDFVRRGVASALMETACQDALACGVTKFWLDASLTAVPFYKATGWQTIKQMMHGELACVRMTKQLG